MPITFHSYGRASFDDRALDSEEQAVLTRQEFLCQQSSGKTLRTRIDQVLAADANADIMAIGDFNDHPTDDGIKTALNTVGTPAEATGGKLLNSMFTTTPDATKSTYVYKNKWEIIDQVVLSPGLLKAPGFRWKDGSSKPLLVIAEQLFDPAGDAIPRPNRSYSGPIFHATGISDHLPVGAVLVK